LAYLTSSVVGAGDTGDAATFPRQFFWAKFGQNFDKIEQN